MAIAISQKSALEVVADVNNTARTRSLGAAAAAGSCIVVLASGWNYQEVGEIISGVTDDGGNSYTRIATSTTGSHGRAEAWIATNVVAATVVSAAISVNNGSNRITWQAIEFSGVDAAALDVSAIGSGGLNSTTFGATTAATAQADEVVVALIGTLWPDSPKNAAAAGYTTIDSVQDTTAVANSMGYLASWKTVASVGTQAVTFTYNAQGQGAQGLIFTLKAGSASGKRVRVSGKDAQAIGASSCIVQIHKAAVDPAEQLFGDFIHAQSGYTIIDDGTGLAGVTIDLPALADVAIGESCIVMIRGLTGGQPWGCHRWVGTVEAIPA